MGTWLKNTKGKIMKNLIDAYIPTIRRHPTQRVKIPCGTKKPERIKLPKPAKIDRFEILYDLPKMKKFRDTRFDDPKPFSWEELKEEAKKIWYDDCYSIHETFEWLVKGKYCFDKDGTFLCDDRVVATDLSYENMLAIMKALQ